MQKMGVFKASAFWVMIIAIASIVFQSVAVAHASFTIEDEKKLGKEFYKKLENSQVILHNEKVNLYITKIGQKILSQSEQAPFDFHFFVIRSASINAFATPGGYVYLNRGLINLVETESELAGILAHEIAHVNARHIASTIEKSKILGIASLAAILAGAFLGGGGDLTAAVASFSLATTTSLSLKYSRENEEEADRLGLSYMVSAGYKGKSMLDFLKIMRRYEFYSNSIPSYFLTHPATDERIRYLDSVLDTIYSKKGADSIIGNLTRIQTILLFGERNLDASLHHFQNVLKKNPNDVDALYGAGVTQERLGRTSEALLLFEKALTISPEDADIMRSLGILYYRHGKPFEGIKFLLNASNLSSDVDTLLYLGRSYEAIHNYEKALEIYRGLEKRNIDDADIYYNIATVYGKTNNKGDSHYYFGMYFKKKKKFDSALFHFKESIKYFPKNSNKYVEIEKQIKSWDREKKTDAI